MADLYMGDDGLHNGALYLAHYANYVYSMGQARKGPTTDPPSRLRFPDAGRIFVLSADWAPEESHRQGVRRRRIAVWNETMAHETYDAYWKALSIYPHLRDIKPAILTVGGWYDAEDLGGTLGIYKTIERLNPGLPNYDRHGALAPQRMESPGRRERGPAARSPSAGRGPIFRTRSSSRSSTIT